METGFLRRKIGGLLLVNPDFWVCVFVDSKGI
jgi:hypothetical protein